MRQIILDTETTGLRTEDGHRVIEIGCVELINRKLTGRHFHRYINPERNVEEGALAVHGITNDFLKDKPLFSDIADEFMDFIQNAELVIHNAPFDIGFLNHELSLSKKKWKPLAHYCRIIDTLILARQLHVGQRNNLDALCKRYGIDNSDRDLHGALLDAHLLAHVYLAMTGGQGSLFEDHETPKPLEEKTLENTVMTSNKIRNLIVLRATPEELAAHSDKLEKMQQKGKCIWLTQIND